MKPSRILAAAALVAVGLTTTASPAHAAKPPPAGCTRALAAAEQVISVATEAFQATATYFDEITTAARTASASGTTAAVTVFLQSQTNSMNRFTDKTRALTPRMASARAAYDTAAKACRAGK